jgi:hypothetical protein
MVLLQKFQRSESLLISVNVEFDLFTTKPTSGLVVSLAADANWLAARSCSSLAAIAVTAVKALRACECACGDNNSYDEGFSSSISFRLTKVRGEVSILS